MSNKRWDYINKTCDKTLVCNLARELNVPTVIASVLVNRGICNEPDARSYLNKAISCVRHPFELKDSQKAASRIKDAIKNNEKIVIYGDYDVDGITATSILYMFLREQDANVSFYIPNRSDEGYGINMLALQKFKKDGASLLITVDCGITAVGEVELARALGIDVIITDHHTCKEELPKAYAVINPKQPDCSYPFKSLAGVGVAFKLVLALALEMGYSAREYFDKYIDLVAIGTIADVVSLTDENRIFVANGINNIKNTKNVGLKALFETSGLADKSINAGSISFAIAPRINAAGRVGSASLAVELLVTDSPERAREIALTLEEENRERQKTENEILKDALLMIADMEDAKKKKVFELAKEDWHHGVIGIVASRIVDRFYKPTILISLKDNLGKGSGRSVKGFNLFDALTNCQDILLKYGGHELAAGLGLNYADVDEFDKQINKYAEDVLKDNQLVPSISIDAELDTSEISLVTAQALLVLEPFGMGNSQPVFSLCDGAITSVRTLSDGKHCKFSVTKNGKYFDFVGFGMGTLTEHFVVGDKIDVAFTMGINHYLGEKNLQLIIKDARASIQ